MKSPLIVAQLKAILNQLEMNLMNSGNRFQVAPQEEEEATEREKEGKLRKLQVVFSHASSAVSVAVDVAAHFTNECTSL